MCVLGRYTLTRFTRHHQTASLISRLQETHKTEGWHEDSQTCTNQLKTRETHFSRETGTKEHIYYWILAVMQGGTMRNNSASAYHFPYIYIYMQKHVNKQVRMCMHSTNRHQPLLFGRAGTYIDSATVSGSLTASIDFHCSPKRYAKADVSLFQFQGIPNN